MRRQGKRAEREREREEDIKDSERSWSHADGEESSSFLIALLVGAVSRCRFVAAARRQAVQSAVPSHGTSHGVRANPILALESRPSQRLRRLETGRPYKCAAVQTVEAPRVERGIGVDPQRTARGRYRLENARCRDIVDT